MFQFRTDTYLYLQVYDVTIRCEVEPLCYNFSLVDALVAQPQVLKSLGVSAKADYEDCNMLVCCDEELIKLLRYIPSYWAIG
jgi:hypothetical protein